MPSELARSVLSALILATACSTGRILMPPCILVLVVKCGRCGRDRPTPPWSTKRPSESLGRRAHCLPEEPEQLPGPSSTKSPHPQGWAIRKERTYLEYYSLCGSGCLQRTPGCCP